MSNYIIKPKGIRKDHWPIVKQSISLMGKGISTRVELFKMLGISSGRSSNLLVSLTREELVETDVINLVGHLRIGLIRLTNKGKEYAQTFCGFNFNQDDTYSEWGHLLNVHQGADQTRHTATTLYFAYFARLCGWQVEIAPKTSTYGFDPDLVLTAGNTRIFFEVEMTERGFKGKNDKWHRKWARQRHEQHHIAVCTLTPKRKERYRKLCQANNWRGYLTDITTLRKQANAGELNGLNDLFEIVDPKK
ncbi:MAG: hypothetical protein JEZ06_20680 [Anaerolineaceae bacterium]|nr:hypothetical protein [Anaerolineaceae bacterium]